MSKEKHECENPDCDVVFLKKAHNAIYCGAECRRIVTNQKVLDKYYENKARRANKKRVCSKRGCTTILSIYNEEDICEPHKTVRLMDRLESWGWDRDDLEEDWSY